MLFRYVGINNTIAGFLCVNMLTIQKQQFVTLYKTTFKPYSEVKHFIIQQTKYVYGRIHSAIFTTVKLYCFSIKYY